VAPATTRDTPGDRPPSIGVGEGRFRGVSKALLSSMERQALDAGISELELETPG